MKFATAKFDAGNSIFPALAVFLLFVLVAWAGGRLVFDRYERQAKAEVTRDLTTVGKLRVNQLSIFLQERRGGARVLAALLGSKQVRDWWQGRDPALPPLLQQTLELAIKEYGYVGALVLDKTGVDRFSAGRSAGLSAQGKSLALGTLTSPLRVLSEIYFADPNAPQELMLDTFAPIMSADGTGVLGILVLRKDWNALFSLTQPWSEGRSSAEYLLARKDGADVLFLNRLRYEQEGTRRMRVQVAGDAQSRMWPAIRAVQGHYGALESLDYRGVRVLAYTLPVPDTDWSMVVKQDEAEVLEGIRPIETAASLSFLAAAALAFALWWWWQHARTRARAALRVSEEKFSKAFHASPDSIALSRLETGEFVEVNEGFENISGYARGEALGRSAIELGLWTQTGQRETLIAQLAMGARIHNLETILRRKDGAERVVLLSLDMIDVSGEKFMLTIGRDVTDAKSTQQAIEQLNAELEQRVRQRTAELQTANKELETFSYSVAHDLKGPLRGIDGYSRLLLADYSDQLDENGLLYLQNVRQAAQQMSQLINDLLAYSRLERRDMQAAAVNPRDLVSALLAEHADEIGRRGVAVNLDLECSSVTADRDGLAMALRNLLGNALKFTRDAPRPAIEIRARDSGSACILEVRDNGVGFDMKYHDRIFDIFQRLHRSEDYHGTGIGLAIVKKAMERMGGRVWAESEPGKGAAFYLEIPE